MEQLHKWADLFLNLPVQEMDPQTAEGFIVCSINIPGTITLDELQANPNGGVAVQIFCNRAKLIDLDMAGNAALFICSICESPGTLVMYAYALRSWQVRHQNRKITMDVIGKELFPMGFPSIQSLSHAWDSQKVGGGNLLDRCDASAFIITQEKHDGTNG
jgi:hypothetical protein